MKTKIKSLKTGLAVAMTLLPGLCGAQTLVAGNISGTWSSSGNPYIATDNCTVPSGTNLTIQPGVVFMIGQNLSLKVNGAIQALGTPSQRITIQAPISSQYWSNIVLNSYVAGTNRFKYCDFMNASTALSMSCANAFDVYTTEILNCTFSNCSSQAIYGGAWSYVTQSLLIKNSVFNNTSNGCVINLKNYYGVGYANPMILGNVFMNLTGTAFLMSNPNGGSSPAKFINNTIVNSRVGVSSQDPWDATIQSCIFVGCSNAVMVSGNLSRSISYNDFYGNATNFTGLPGTYGTIIWNNRNGTPADALFNIYQNPLFVTTNDFHLQANSPCIDAGTPDWAYTDMCFPPSQGTSFPDLGAYGGPDAANWLDTVPKLAATLSMSQSNHVMTLGWGALPRSEYQIQYVTNLALLPATNNWINFTNGHVLAMDKPTSMVVATNTALNGQFFRVQSLGRTPGN